MPTSAPVRIAIDRDDSHAEHIGITTDGRQFFITAPFVPAEIGIPGCEYIALYVFDKYGHLLDAVIESLGQRSAVSALTRISRREELIKGLGPVEGQRITIAPFKVKRFGVEFGLIAYPPEEGDDDWRVVAEPGEYMCFWPPWNSGEYDT